MAPINALVDELHDEQGRGWLPYVAPVHGGTRARVLSVLRDPGPATQVGVGSGFLCVENDDATAEQQARGFADAGIALEEVTPWNAYPWYINRKPTGEELDAGVDALMRLIALMPRLTVVLLQGRDAQACWKRLVRHEPLPLQKLGLEVVQTYHPSQQALWAPNPDERDRRRQHRLDAYKRVARLLERSSAADGP
ncbi:uracil-DNA glycosylase [Mangrovihabitans endophyticus]|uniref:uracil-DNA glycosylase n=1 Tax=Mangrovihabitans endophyticus TaxID=1751298 RepID=UPI001E335749|nr:uracil-DNA glycosylase [Mangrovihabitans endophyticus]